MQNRRAITMCVLGLILTFSVSAAPIRMATPAGFTDTLITSVTQPTALAFTPDGRLLITGKLGRLFVYQNDQLLQQPAINLGSKICNNRERGLLGVAVDPHFAANRYIYLYYTAARGSDCPIREESGTAGPANRVSRFQLLDSNTIDPQSEVVLLDTIPSPTGRHNAGDLHFGADGLLYISAGDGSCALGAPANCGVQNNNAQRLDHLAGKLLRIMPDGSIPPDNPYLQSSDSRRCGAPGAQAGSGPCQEIYAHGLRNPFRFAFRPGTNELYVNDVGQSDWEEINQAQAGANYGWNSREGPCTTGSTTDCPAAPAGLTDPLYAYDHSDGCASITGGVFVPPGLWPAEYDGTYLFGDYVCGTIFRLVASGAGLSAEPFITGLGDDSVLSMIAGPAAIYYTTFGGQVRQITYSGTTNRPPTAIAAAQPVFGPAPLLVRFDASASSDPDGDALTYTWDFGDGTAPATGSKPSHTYQSEGVYTATLQVEDSEGLRSEAVGVRIDVGNSPPVPAITGGPQNERFYVGEQITLHGAATDEQDGELSGTALSWTVILHHDQHTHPFMPPTPGAEITIEAPGPEDLSATTTSYLEVQLTATDSHGLTSVITGTLQPQIIDVTLITQPPELELLVNNERVTGGQAIHSWQGLGLQVEPPLQVVGGKTLICSYWSDGSTSAARTITTPDSAIQYTATFVEARSVFLPLAATQAP